MAHALESVENVAVRLPDSIRQSTSTEGKANATASKAARYLQALSEWETLRQPGERRAEAALCIRQFLATPAPDNLLSLCGLGLRQSPPLPDVPNLNLNFNANRPTELPTLPEGMKALLCSDDPWFPYLICRTV
jgi:hypothetical protein